MSRPLTVILDNGHGSNTAGKRYSFGSKTIYEYEFNRNVVALITQMLKEAAIPCVTIVPELNDVSLTARIQRVNWKVAAVNKAGFQTVLISVHANAGGGTGFEVWTSKGKTRSDQLAELLLNAAPKYLKGFPLRKDVTDGDGDKESERFAMLTKTHCPAVLTENLFMDNLADFNFISSHEGRVAIAQMHVDAIQNYKNTL